MLHANWLEHQSWRAACDKAKREEEPLPLNPFADAIKHSRKNRSGLRVQLAKKPHYPNVAMNEIQSSNIWNCPSMVPAIKDFIYREVKGVHNYSISRANGEFTLEFDRLHCWQRITFHDPSITGLMSYTGLLNESVQCHPWKSNETSELYGGRQDVVLIKTWNSAEKAGMSGMFILYCRSNSLISLLIWM